MERMLAVVVEHSPLGGVSESPSVCGHDGYLAGYASDRGKTYSALAEAMMVCLSGPTAGGVTKEDVGVYTVRAGSELTLSPSNAMSWPPRSVYIRARSTILQNFYNEQKGAEVES
jgi:hypothetical protein